jgi:hypothetical protein
MLAKDYRKSSAVRVTRYRAAPKSKANVIPSTIDNKVAKIEPKTDVAPFTAQNQAPHAGLPRANNVIPRGNPHPMKNPGKRTRTVATAIRNVVLDTAKLSTEDAEINAERQMSSADNVMPMESKRSGLPPLRNRMATK